MEKIKSLEEEASRRKKSAIGATILFGIILVMGTFIILFPLLE